MNCTPSPPTGNGSRHCHPTRLIPTIQGCAPVKPAMPTSLARVYIASGPAAEQRLFDLLNSERIQQKLPALSLDQDLVEAARKHSEAMAKGKRLAHQMPGEASLNPRIAAAGARFDAVAENVAHSGSVEDAHVELLHSAGHRANILSREYDAVGIGIAAV